ncbi:MAG: serine/threonine-protein kinase [Pyrinomonadaceae bacterium]
MKICSVCDRCFEEDATFCFDPDHGELTDGPHAIDIVPGYRIERLIISSPNAVAYQAQQIEYGQECLIAIADGDPTVFLSDAKLAAGLFHAGVAGVVESGGLSNGSGFAVFEGFGGTSLRNVLSEGSLSLLDRIRIARQTAESIHAIHLAGLNHGALRPENVWITGGGDDLSVKVHNTDLGSAFAGGVLSNRFSMDSSLDSLRYFAPERFRGEAATAQSDVYSLGILLYELLSGHLPFEASSAAALADMHLHQKPPEIKIENFDLRMLLTHTIFESLQKHSSFRQSTADLFARQMRHIEQLATHVSTPPPAVAVRAAVPSISRSIPTYIRPEAQRVSIRPVEVTAPISMPTKVPVENAVPVAAAIELPDEVFVEHIVPITAPVAYVPMPTKRSRLRGMKTFHRSKRFATN